MLRILIHPLLRWSPAVGWMVLVFWFSSQSTLPRADDPLIELLFKKGTHVLAYTVLAICYLWGFGTWRARWMALGLAVLYALSDEYHQSWTPGRHPALTDVMIDTGGAMLGLWVVAPYAARLLQEQFKIRMIVPSK